VLRFLQLAPYIGLALLFGDWVDRVSRRKVMLWTNVARMVLIAAVPVMHWTGVLDMPILLVIACAVGVASVLFDVSWMPFVPTLVKDTRHYVEASAKMGISSSVSDVAGPGIAGLLVAVLTAPVALIVDAFSYVVSVFSLPDRRDDLEEGHHAVSAQEGLFRCTDRPAPRPDGDRHGRWPETSGGDPDDRLLLHHLASRVCCNALG
jgi:MFS family permease